MKILLIYILLSITTPLLGNEFIFSSMGVTNHGTGVDEELADQMPHKISDNGKWIYHPIDFSANYINNQNVHYNFTYLKDSFNEQAAMLGIGHHWKLWRGGLGYLVGVYGRERHYFISRKGNVTYPSDMRYVIEHNNIEYIPMAFATASLRIKATEPYIDLLFAGNWFLNHAELGVGFSW